LEKLKKTILKNHKIHKFSYSSIGEKPKYDKF